MSCLVLNATVIFDDNKNCYFVTPGMKLGLFAQRIEIVEDVSRAGRRSIMFDRRDLILDCVKLFTLVMI
jgi:hypothetical protein